MPSEATLDEEMMHRPTARMIHFFALNSYKSICWTKEMSPDVTKR